MKTDAVSIEDYLKKLPEDRVEPVQKLRQTILDNLPDGFEETMSYGMIGYVVPHRIFPAGYHCDPKLPLPFINIASQKNFVALYHMGMYADPELLNWFTNEYPNHVKSKLDMGKSCVRFKKMDQIPYALIAELLKKMTAQNWIDLYQKNYTDNRKK